MGQFLSSGTISNTYAANLAQSHSHHRSYIHYNQPHHYFLNLSGSAPHTQQQSGTIGIGGNGVGVSAINISSSAGTTPTAPNIISAQQHQYGFTNIMLGAPGRL